MERSLSQRACRARALAAAAYAAAVHAPGVAQQPSRGPAREQRSAAPHTGRAKADTHQRLPPPKPQPQPPRLRSDAAPVSGGQQRGRHQRRQRGCHVCAWSASAMSVWPLLQRHWPAASGARRGLQSSAVPRRRRRPPAHRGAAATGRQEPTPVTRVAAATPLRALRRPRRRRCATSKRAAVAAPRARGAAHSALGTRRPANNSAEQHCNATAARLHARTGHAPAARRLRSRRSWRGARCGPCPPRRGRRCRW
jgi:hypothetical protein